MFVHLSTSGRRTRSKSLKMKMSDICFSSAAAVNHIKQDMKNMNRLWSESLAWHICDHLVMCWRSSAQAILFPKHLQSDDGVASRRQERIEELHQRWHGHVLPYSRINNSEKRHRPLGFHRNSVCLTDDLRRNPADLLAKFAKLQFLL